MSVIVSSPLSTTPRPPATVLIATDVFGHTPAVSGLVRQLGINALVVSPWDDNETEFRTEHDAYQAFIVEGGIARYTNKLLGILQDQSALRFVIGFSAGASALWINSAQECMKSVEHAVLFYGSRIRDFREIKPVCPMRLIFAEEEAAFDPSALVDDLNRHGQSAEMAKGTKHGFMNSYSRGSCVKSQTRYLAEIIALIHANADKEAA